MKTKLLLIVVIGLLINTIAFSQTGDKRLDSLKLELTKFIEKEMKSKKVVGISIALVDNQETVWAEGFGFADKEKEVKATSQTIYRIGSVSKLFTALSVMQLTEQGKINIDNPVRTYIPDFKIKSRFDKPGIITTRGLLTHHSGIPSSMNYKFFSDNPFPIDSIVELLNEEYTCTQPNTIWSYSNPAYTLLGVLTEKVSGEKFKDYTQNHLFQPMNMKNSSFVLTKDMEKFYAKGYTNGKEFNEPYISQYPAGTVHSNVLDMANFIKMICNNGSFNGKQIIKEETLNEMLTQQNKDCILDDKFIMGLCWMMDSNIWNYAGKRVGHGGDTQAISRSGWRMISDSLSCRA